ncbi:MAG: EpsG family protein [Tuberibacillus sp.]
MEILWVNFLVVYVTSWLARYFARPVNHLAPYIKPNKFLIFMVMATLVIVSGLRKNIGDTYFYKYTYTITQFDLANIDFKGEFGFYFLQYLLHKITDDPQILVFTTALVTDVLIVLVLYKYSRMIEISLFVFIASGLFTVTMNGIRQSLAAAIIFAATKYLLDGHWKKFMVVVLLASTIHHSAIVFIPIYFLVRRKAWTKMTFLMLIMAVIITLEFNTFSSIIFGALDSTKYGEYSASTEGGANIIRAFVTAVPLLIAYLGREKLRELWPKSDMIVNLSLLSLIFMIVATRNWIFARLDIYFDLYQLILISWILLLFRKQERPFIYYGLLICYLIYFFYDQVITLNLVYHSDYLIW